MSRPPSRTDRARRLREQGGGVATESRSAAVRTDLIGWKTFGYAVIVMVCLTLLGVVTVWLRPLEVIDVLTHARLAYAGFHNETARVHGQRIHYYEGGGGDRPVLLIHGLGSRAEDWANLMPALKQAGFHVYAIDLLGYGRSARPSDASYSIAEEAGYVEDFLRDRGLDHVAVAGWSMGGWVAMRVALDQPHRVDRLVLCDAAGIRFTPGFDIDDFEPTTIDSVRKLYRQLSPAAPEVPDFLARAMVRKFSRINWVINRSVRSMFKGDDLLDGKLAALHMPTLLIWGRMDYITPLSEGVALHQQIPQSSLEIYDGCGHLAPGQCAHRVTPRFIQFLNGNGPAPQQTVDIPQH